MIFFLKIYQKFDCFQNLNNFIAKIIKEHDYSIYKLDLTFGTYKIFYSNDYLLIIEGEGSGSNEFRAFYKFLKNIQDVIFKFNYWETAL